MTSTASDHPLDNVIWTALNQGLPADLMRLVSQGIVARGETPFLHVLAEDASAIALYDKLGFRRRQQTRRTILRRDEASV